MIIGSQYQCARYIQLHKAVVTSSWTLKILLTSTVFGEVGDTTHMERGTPVCKLNGSYVAYLYTESKSIRGDIHLLWFCISDNCAVFSHSAKAVTAWMDWSLSPHKEEWTTSKFPEGIISSNTMKSMKEWCKHWPITMYKTAFVILVMLSNLQNSES